MITIYYGNVTKRRNSTLRPSLTDSIQALLKDGTLEDSPVFLLKADSFNYNYVIWDDNYYFVDSVEYVKNGLIRISCVLDVLATYKSEILATTAYVSYSSVSTSKWLADTRIPVLKNTTVSKNSVDMGIFSPSNTGTYILTVIGETGCESFSLSLASLRLLINTMQDNVTEQITEITKDLDFSSTEKALESLSMATTRCDVLGNAYQNAPSCIRSCIWIPFMTQSSGGGEIMLGNWKTGINGASVDASPRTGSVSVAIPWQNDDWRRGYSEDIYLYLPLVGMIGIETSSITNATSIVIDYSYTLVDGKIAYQVKVGDEIIGSYGGSCMATYALGINQTASAGEVANALVSGISKTVSSAITAGLNVVSTGVGLAVGALETTYNVADTAMSTHPTCIGGVGGAAGSGLDKSIVCYSVNHDLTIEPETMKSTMGVPTMAPLQLSNCSGYCECANAHVSAPAHAGVLNEIDRFLNSGFYIE